MARDRATDSAGDDYPGGWTPFPYITWQHAVYVLALGVTCMFLIPLTPAWWVVLALGVSIPFAAFYLREHMRRGCEPCDLRGCPRSRSEGRIQPSDCSNVPVGQSVHLRDDAGTSMPLMTADHSGQHAAGRTGAALATAPLSHEHDTLRDLGDRSDRGVQAGALVESLSARELEVLRLLASGKTYAEAADHLVLSVGTIKSHSGSIYRKLDARNRAEAIARAREFGLIV